MEYKDIIEKLQKMRHLYEQILHDDIGVTVIDKATSALKKQKPVKIEKEWDGYYGKNEPCCGSCGAYIKEYDKYCSRCGQKIDWGE